MVPNAQRNQDFTQFVEAIEPRLMSYLRYTTGSMADAEDLFQETMMRAHRDWQAVIDKDQPQAWVFTIARNLAMNTLKRRGTELRVLRSRQEGVADMPDQPVEGEETRRLVQEALQTLPVDQREAVSLKVWGELSWLEIGRALGVSDDTASRLFARGLKAIAPMLKGVSP